MDYEKKYKEALERADSLTEKYGGRDFAEYVFPELAESEDERIRKELIEHVKDQIDSFISPLDCRDKEEEEELQRYKSWIVYLEKQKEQKPISWTELTWKDIVELEGIINNVHYEFRNGIGQESFGKEVLEKFREYKGDECLDEIEQKPARWNANDKAFIKDCARILNENGYAASAERLLSMFEQKPSWSEEDEKMISKITDAITGYHPTRSTKENEEMIAFLKSLRPSWKPSKKQMGALEDAFRKDGSDEYRRTINSLYQDLKKL